VCEQCRLSLRKCTYAKTADEVPFEVDHSLSLLPGPDATLPLVPAFALPLDAALSCISDADLYQHFVEHTSKRSFPPQKAVGDAYYAEVLRLGLESEPLAHAILALSAACICCDMMVSGRGTAAVESVLNVGLHYHTLSIQEIRPTLTNPGNVNRAALLSACTLLIPFAVGFQHINYWVKSHGGVQEVDILPTPGDAIKLLRGMRPLFEVIGADILLASTSAQGKPQDESVFVHPSRLHPMFQIISVTLDQAFSRLKNRIDAFQSPQEPASAHLAAAFEVLDDIARNHYLTPEKGFESDKNIANATSPASETSLAKMVCYIQTCVGERPSSLARNPLHWMVFSFFRCAPAEFLDLLLPLLDQPPQSLLKVMSRNVGTSGQLTSSQVIALDIYAHWLVLLLPLNYEEWCLAEFPAVAMQGFLRWYGEVFISSYGQHDWWPRIMWNKTMGVTAVP
jgi:hypothetical protein